MIKLQDYLEKYGNIEVEEKKMNEVLGVKSKRWMPNVGEIYFYINTFGEIMKLKWDGLGLDRSILDYDELYPTEKEAEFARDKKQFLLKMKRDFEDNTDEIDWGKVEQYKYYVSYDHGYGTFDITYCNRVQTQGALHTTDSEWLRQYIEDNEQDIRKYVFGLEGDPTCGL